MQTESPEQEIQLFKESGLPDDWLAYRIERTAEGGERAISTMVVEPWTWAWVLVKIGEGIVTGVGERILSRLLGERPLASIVEDAVRTICSHIDHAIRVNELGKLMSNAVTVGDYIIDYNESKDPGFLFSAMTKATELRNDADLYGHDAAGVYAVACNVYLVAVQARMKLPQYGNDANLFKTRVAEFKKKVTGIRNYFAGMYQYDISEIYTGKRKFFKCWRCVDGDGMGTHRECGAIEKMAYLYKVKGVEHQFESHSRAVDARSNDIYARDNLKSTIEKQIINPIDANTMNWDKALESIS